MGGSSGERGMREGVKEETVKTNGQVRSNLET